MEPAADDQVVRSFAYRSRSIKPRSAKIDFFDGSEIGKPKR
jgi:hypothetical protein